MAAASARRPGGATLLLLLATALVLALAPGARGAAPVPREGRAWLELRELRVGALGRDRTVRWDEFQFARVSVSFDQPLYKASVVRGVPVHRRFNSSAVDASLDGALELRCRDAAGALPLRTDRAAAARLWEAPLAALVPVGAPGDLLPDAALLFEPADQAAPRPARNRLDLLAVTSFRRHGADEVHLLPPGTDLARACTVAYVPLDARPGAAARAAAAERAAANGTALAEAEAALDAAPAMLANVQGEEARMKGAPLVPRAGREARATRALFRLSGEPAWADEVSHPTAEAARPVFERAALLESRHEVGMPLAKMFKPVTAGVLEPIVQIAVVHCNAAMINVMVQEASHSVVKEVAPDVSMMLGDRLLANLTNILTDSVSYTVSRSLATALTRVLDPYLTWSIADSLVPVLHVILQDALKDRIPNKLDSFLPELLNRLLPLTLTHSLTRAVPHIVVATLTHTLTHSKRADHYCWSCFYKQEHCSLCHFSRSSMYYQIYHSTYYVDYYSNYYADYYANALKLMDAERYPNTPGTEPPG